MRLTRRNHLLESPLRRHEIRLRFPFYFVPNDVPDCRGGNPQDARAHVADKLSVGYAEKTCLDDIAVGHRVVFALRRDTPGAQAGDLRPGIEIDAHDSSILPLGAQDLECLTLQFPHAPVREYGDRSFGIQQNRVGLRIVIRQRHSNLGVQPSWRIRGAGVGHRGERDGANRCDRARECGQARLGEHEHQFRAGRGATSGETMICSSSPVLTV